MADETVQQSGEVAAAEPIHFSDISFMTAILAIIHNPAVERTARGVGATLATQVAAPDFWPQLMSVLPPPYNLVAIPVLMGIAKALRMVFPDNAILKYLPV